MRTSLASLRKLVLAAAKPSYSGNFAAAVASFGMLLRDSQYKGQATFGTVLTLADAGVKAEEDPYRSEFIGLVETAARLSNPARSP